MKSLIAFSNVHRIVRVWPTSVAVVIAVSCATLAACSKTETIPTTAERLKAVNQQQETTTDFYLPRKSVDYMTDLKNIRDNATQEAQPASKDSPKESTKAAARTQAGTSSATSAAASVTPPAATSGSTPAAPTVATPPTVTPTPAPAAVTATTAPPRPSPQPAPAAAPPVTVASAAPTARPAAPPTQVASPTVSVVAREQPEFPREAIRQGIDSGVVRARLTINAAGDVTNVAIVQAKPVRVFDRAVTTSLSRWKFNPGADGRAYETEVAFER
jgi:TonB family protein